MARRAGRILLLVLPAAAWAQEPPVKYRGLTAAEWVDRLPDGEGEDEAWAAVQAIGAPCVPLILERLAATGASDLRLELAVEEMGVRATSTLLEALKEGKPQVRLCALYFLLQLRENMPAELEDLVPPLLADKDRDVRMGVALQLCELGFDDVSALPPLLEALQSREHRARAASLLWLFREEAARVVPALLQASRDDDGYVRASALASLWAFWTTRPDAKARILEASESEDPADRRAAVPEEGGSTSDVVALCLKAADDPDHAVREKAREALRWSWRRTGLGESANAALSHPRAEIRQLACETVGDGETRLLAAVLQRIDDRDEGVRLAALDAIDRIGDAGPEVRSRVRRLLAGGRSETAQRAAWVLIHLDVDVDEAAAVLVGAWKALDVAAVLGPRATVAVPAIREMLDAVPCEAAHALHVVTGEVDAPLEALRGELQNTDWPRRLEACQTAELFGPAAAPLVPLLTRCLDDEATHVRRFAATALGYAGAASKPAIPKLIALLDDHEGGESAVCRHAAAALAWLDVDTPKVKEILAKVIEEESPNDGNTRPGALRYFWKHDLMPVEEVVRRCRDSLGPPNWDDVLPILRLLAEIGAPAEPAIPDLEDLRGARLYAIRAAAADAIRRIRPR